MSFGKFLKKIWSGIKKFFEGLEPKAKEAIAIGVTVVDKMKEFFDSETPDIITSIIPGTLDDKIKDAIRAALPKIVMELQLAAKCMDETEPDKIVACALETLKGISPEFRKDFYDSLATQIALVAADGKLTWDDVKSTIKWYNDHVKKQALPEPAGISNEL